MVYDSAGVLTERLFAALKLLAVRLGANSIMYLGFSFLIQKDTTRFLTFWQQETLKNFSLKPTTSEEREREREKERERERESVCLGASGGNKQTAWWGSLTETVSLCSELILRMSC